MIFYKLSHALKTFQVPQQTEYHLHIPAKHAQVRKQHKKPRKKEKQEKFVKEELPTKEKGTGPKNKKIKMRTANK